MEHKTQQIEFDVIVFEDKNIKTNPDKICIKLLDSSNKKMIGEIFAYLANSKSYYLICFVNEKYRKMGFSNKLFNMMFEKLREPKFMNIDSVIIDIQPLDDCDFNWLVDYYKKLGFIEYDKYNRYIKIL